MQQQYYLAKNGEQVGPLSPTQVIEKIQAGEYGLTDYYFDDARQDWVMLIEQSDFKMVFNQVKSQPPQARPAQAPSPEPEQGHEEWFVLKGDNKYGPFGYIDLIKMLQEKKLFEYDYLWHRGLEGWKRVAEMEEFSAEKVREMVQQSAGDKENVFFRRRHMRVELGTSLIIHDNHRVWKGESLEISAGGAGIIMHNSTLKPGDLVYMHFKPADDMKPFNAVCEIVSKAFVSDINAPDAPVRYGVQFKEISEDAHLKVTDYIKSAA